MSGRAWPLLIALLAPAALTAQQKVKLPARDRMLTEKPAVVYTIGREEGEEWEMLSGVLAVAFDARDQLYVLDSNNHRVLVFDVAGKFVRRISQRGQGPGELMAPTGLAVMTDGTVVVSDGGRRAFSLFRSDGTFIRNVLFGEDEGMGGGRTAFAATGDFGLDAVRAHPAGGIVVQVFPRRVRTPGTLGAPTGARKVPVKHIELSAPSGAATVLYEFTLPSITPKVTDRPGRGVSVTTQPPYWTPAATLGVLPNGGVVVADGAQYRVQVVSRAGRVERIIERPIAPRKGTPTDKQNFLARQREALTSAGVSASRRADGRATSTGALPPEAIEGLLNSATWLEVIPVLRRVTADAQNRIWVARTPADFGVYGPVDLVRADGAYIGTIANTILPAAVSSSGRAAFVERDELGVEHVTVKRLPATWQ